ncbi:hypothetical protein NDU88_002809 [Pleurodeles waltl]|uniref:Uncharacterized protein n=1 Tax=Pleurodeles waltl TaxID=8319 RepID=A0AAV7KVS5_PLEWA|nr:hypothetical protein NDU88_002809 [Pleurodeles waltl]
MERRRRCQQEDNAVQEAGQPWRGTGERCRRRDGVSRPATLWEESGPVRFAHERCKSSGLQQIFRKKPFFKHFAVQLHQGRKGWRKLVCVLVFPRPGPKWIPTSTAKS